MAKRPYVPPHMQAVRALIALNAACTRTDEIRHLMPSTAAELDRIGERIAGIHQSLTDALEEDIRARVQGEEVRRG